ncbi:MAG: thioredoxin family protein [Tenuifilum sp.]|uniref:thioredoxin family protein n=1 Tax=Tenuifilum sp. TaxID=2760880 RepID=UPI001B570295|nr:TM0996/MTH895 family glutaredoxin-like protein [Bacteroidales bacterium]HOK62148.1 thioredoxin family protein [Tenuifilum sp.]MBP9030102.1 TM0996/MTH895 family glutaredoxin-like protein [Bacteroidales bacterium]HOK86176.1 thioredoxin family protein [Tenuifilum sp.]HOU75132.1 thioredoxin family protein [Tenuifilum sp.]
MVEIKVLGIGCPNCHKLEAMCHEVVNELGIDAHIESVTDMNQFMDYGVLLTPALVINNEVKVQGKLPLKPTLVNWIKQGDK